MTKRPREISQPVKDYVLRAFDAEDRFPGISTDELSSRLNAVITERLSSGLEFTTDWSRLLLPQEMIMQDRLRAAPPPVFNHWLVQSQPSSAPLPPHLPPPPPPPTNMMSTTHTSLFVPAARQGPFEEQHERANKRRYHEERDPSPHKKPRAQSPVRRSRYDKLSIHHLEKRSDLNYYRPPPHRRLTDSSSWRDGTRSTTRYRLSYDDVGDRLRSAYTRSPSPKWLRHEYPSPTRNRNNDNRDSWDRFNGTQSPDWTPSPPTDKYDRSLDERASKSKQRKNEEDRKYVQRQQERRKQDEKHSKRERDEHGKLKKQKHTEFEKRQREEELIKRKERLMRFAASKPPIQTKPNAPANPYGRLVGINTDLEKDYYRLTSDPKPELVRSQDVLEKSLVLVKQKWAKERRYNYVKSQLKSIRQDLVVQHIKNSFTIEVYKTHARIALEMSDLGEYNQCQTQLHTLHKTMRKRLPTEFIAYRILYFVLTKNGPAMNDIVLEINEDERKDAAVKNALDIRSAIALGNYYRFFQLCKDVPNLGRYLVQSFMTRQRLAALANYARTYVIPLLTTNMYDQNANMW